MSADEVAVAASRLIILLHGRPKPRLICSECPLQTDEPAVDQPSVCQLCSSDEAMHLSSVACEKPKKGCIVHSNIHERNGVERQSTIPSMGVDRF